MTEPKNLKKSDFLAAFEDNISMSKEEINSKLSDFTFISSYLDYLIDHFLGLGKIQLNEDGTFVKKTKVKATRSIYRVVNTDGNWSMEEKQITGNPDLSEGHSVTKTAAVKRAVTAMNNAAKLQIKAIKELL